MIAFPSAMFPPRVLRLLLLAAAFLLVPMPGVFAEGLLPGATTLGPDEFYRVNNTARGLAGLPAISNRAAAGWESSPDWQAYAQIMEGRWNYIRQIRLNAMRSWALSDLGSFQDQPTVFYPFSGPDFLYVDTLFPNARDIVMGGLEPVGSLPDLNALQQQGLLRPYLDQIKGALYTIMAASFFKTKDMKTDLHSGQVDGLLPVMAVFLAQQGYTIDSLNYLALESNGSLHPAAPGDANGVQITFFNGYRSNTRTLLYLQTDLSNDGLKSNPGYVRLMHRLAPGVTYLKAASYLLHEDFFSTIRDAILDNSLGVVEDDSGIPLRDFKASLWEITPYGNYTGPLPVFQQYNQPDLARFYAEHPHPPLSFGSGYKFIAAQSSLLVAHKVPLQPGASP